MAKSDIKIVEALRKAASNIENGAAYQWGHMGSCNCGHLAQVVTNKNKAEIHQTAMKRHGDWNEQLTDYCPASGIAIDFIIDEMMAFGFTRSDLAHLEKLSDPQIARLLPNDHKHLKHNLRQDVILYLKTWATKLENDLLENISLADLTIITKPVKV